MAYKYTGDSILGVSLTVEAPKPLDSRSVVNNLEDLYSIPEKYAYQGMTVANIDNGNIYMLLDKSKISEKEGWKASYESIQIISCSQEEYDALRSNTTEDFKPIDPAKDYLHAETYYYIYEEDTGQYYLSSAWGKQIEEQLSKKASNDAVVGLLQKVNADIANLKDNYTTTEVLEANYVLLSSLDLSDPLSFLSTTLAKYYTKEEVNDIFVTKESLSGGGSEDFVFVTKKKYDEDQQLIKDELDKTLKVDGEGSLDSITVGQVKSPIVEDKQLIIDVKPEGLYVGADKMALLSEVPNLITLTEEEYKALVDAGKIEEDTYYYVYNTTDDNKVYVTKEYLEATYSTTNQYQSWISNNYYSKLQSDNKYVTLENIKSYYTKTESNSKFLAQLDASSTYATKQQVTELQTLVETDYVTKESLRGDGTDPGDDDFIFVTQNKYNNDLAAAKEKIETKVVKTNTASTSSLIIYKSEEKEVEQVTSGGSSQVTESEIIVTSQVELTSNDNKVLANGKPLSLEEDVPKVVCLDQPSYDDLVENNTTKEDTYYFTYGERSLIDTGYVTSELLAKEYYNKEEVAQLIQDAIAPLIEKINAIESGSSNAQIDSNNEQLIFN